MTWVIVSVLAVALVQVVVWVRTSLALAEVRTAIVAAHAQVMSAERAAQTDALAIRRDIEALRVQVALAPKPKARAARVAPAK